MLTVSLHLLQRHKVCGSPILTSINIYPKVWMELSFAACLEGQGIQTVGEQKSGKEILKGKLWDGEALMCIERRERKSLRWFREAAFP